MGYAVFAAAGFALFQLTGQPPHGEASVPFMVGAVAYGVAFALLGGYLSGWIAGRRSVAHAAVVAVILALGATASLVATLGTGTVWSQVSAIAVMAPAAVAGGWLRQRVAGPAEPPGAAADRGRDVGSSEHDGSARGPGG